MQSVNCTSSFTKIQINFSHLYSLPPMYTSFHSIKILCSTQFTENRYSGHTANKCHPRDLSEKTIKTIYTSNSE